MSLLLVTLAGALGCLFRFLIEYAFRRHHPTIRPWGTVVANALGCFIAAYVVFNLSLTISPRWHDVLTTGFCGGLTTFSSAFAIPAILMKEHAKKYAIALVTTTPLACALAYALGAALPR